MKWQSPNPWNDFPVDSLFEKMNSEKKQWTNICTTVIFMYAFFWKDNYHKQTKSTPVKHWMHFHMFCSWRKHPLCRRVCIFNYFEKHKRCQKKNVFFSLVDVQCFFCFCRKGNNCSHIYIYICIIEKDLCKKKYIAVTGLRWFLVGCLHQVGAHQVFFQRQLAVETLSSHSEIDVDSWAPWRTFHILNITSYTHEAVRRFSAQDFTTVFCNKESCSANYVGLG